MAVYVSSDLHGRFDSFLALLQKAAFSADDYCFVLGDVIDHVVTEVVIGRCMDRIGLKHPVLIVGLVDVA